MNTKKTIEIMRTNFVVLLALGLSMTANAQKNEIKVAEKALKSGNVIEAQSALTAAEGVIDGAEAKLQSQYYFTKGKVYMDLAKKGDATAFTTAAESFRKVVSIEEAGKKKYTVQAQQSMTQLTSDLVNSAIEDNNNENFSVAANKLYMAYGMSPADTLYLYYAANGSVQAKDYENALKYYNELKEVDYDGSTLLYTATEVETGENKELSKQEFDLYKKSNQYKDFKEERTESKRAEIIKNIALIYQQVGENDKALAAFSEARAAYPDDVNLVLNEANLQYNLGNKDKFKELMAEASGMDPNNPDLHYNVGVINMEQGDIEGARASFNKALEIDPKYTNAVLNLSTTYVNEGNGLVDQMNDLASSFKKADIAKYDNLKAKKDGLFQQGATILEKALTDSPDNQGILSQLKNIYGALGDNDNFLRIKKLLGE